MDNNQSFNVDDIRRVRDEADIRYKNMTSEEISNDIHECAQIGYQILKNIKDNEAKQKGA